MTRETIHDPNGLRAFREYKHGPYTLLTWPGGNNRDGKPHFRYDGPEGKLSEELRRPAAAFRLRQMKQISRIEKILKS